MSADLQVVRDEQGKPRVVVNPAGDGTKGFYADQYREGERTRIAAQTATANLADEIWMQRVINRRLLERVTQADPDDLTLEQLAEVTRALALGTGRVAQLMRENQTLTGGVEGGLKAVFERALDELAEEEGWKI